jgi:hypothetical protein
MRAPTVPASTTPAPPGVMASKVMLRSTTKPANRTDTGIVTPTAVMHSQSRMP